MEKGKSWRAISTPFENSLLISSISTMHGCWIVSYPAHHAYVRAVFSTSFIFLKILKYKWSKYNYKFIKMYSNCCNLVLTGSEVFAAVIFKGSLFFIYLCLKWIILKRIYLKWTIKWIYSFRFIFLL